MKPLHERWLPGWKVVCCETWMADVRMRQLCGKSGLTDHIRWLMTSTGRCRWRCMRRVKHFLVVGFLGLVAQLRGVSRWYWFVYNDETEWQPCWIVTHWLEKLHDGKASFQYNMLLVAAQQLIFSPTNYSGYNRSLSTHMLESKHISYALPRARRGISNNYNF